MPAGGTSARPPRASEYVQSWLAKGQGDGKKGEDASRPVETVEHLERDLVDLNDVGVREPGEPSRFSQETSPVGGVVLAIAPKDLDGHLKVLIVCICCHKNSSKCSYAKHFSFVVNHIVLLEFSDTLLFSAFVT